MHPNAVSNEFSVGQILAIDDWRSITFGWDARRWSEVEEAKRDRFHCCKDKSWATSVKEDAIRSVIVRSDYSILIRILVFSRIRPALNRLVKCCTEHPRSAA